MKDQHQSESSRRDENAESIGAKLPFEEPRLIKDSDWTLENVTASLGGFMSGSLGGGNLHNPASRPR